MEFGCFAGFLVPPEGGSSETRALLRIDISAAKGRNNTKFTDILLVVSEQNLMRYEICLLSQVLKVVFKVTQANESRLIKVSSSVFSQKHSQICSSQICSLLQASCCSD